MTEFIRARSTAKYSGDIQSMAARETSNGKVQSYLDFTMT